MPFSNVDLAELTYDGHVPYEIRCAAADDDARGVKPPEPQPVEIDQVHSARYVGDHPLAHGLNGTAFRSITGSWTWEYRSDLLHLVLPVKRTDLVLL